MSFWDKVQEATPSWLGGTGGNLTANDQAALIAQGQSQINDVRTNAEYYYGVGSDAALEAAQAAEYNSALTPGDVAAVAAANAKENGQCSLLSVVNGQAPFDLCYPRAKWFAVAAIVIFVLWLVAPYVSIFAGLTNRRK